MYFIFNQRSVKSRTLLNSCPSLANGQDLMKVVKEKTQINLDQ